MIDLHIHLDGAVSFESARMLAAMQGLPVLGDEELREKMQVRPGNDSLAEFLTKFHYPCSLLQTKEAITQCVHNLLQDLRRNGTEYAEIHFAPIFCMDGGLGQEEALQAAIAGLDDSIVPARFILCCIRLDFDALYDKNMETARLAVKYHGKGVVAMGLACDDGTYDIASYAPFFEHARQAGVPLSIHAGETRMNGVQSVIDAINLGASRIDHGVQASLSDEAMSLLQQKDIPLTICQSSNLCTGVYKDIKEIPILEFKRRGIRFCLATDDPCVENTTLEREYSLLKENFGYTDAEILEMQKQAIEISFAPEEIKEKLRKM